MYSNLRNHVKPYFQVFYQVDPQQQQISPRCLNQESAETTGLLHPMLLELPQQHLSVSFLLKWSWSSTILCQHSPSPGLSQFTLTLLKTLLRLNIPMDSLFSTSRRLAETYLLLLMLISPQWKHMNYQNILLEFPTKNFHIFLKVSWSPDEQTIILPQVLRWTYQPINSGISRSCDQRDQIL